MASIETTPTGFSVRYRVDGKSRRKNFKTKSEAKKFVALLYLTPQKRSAILKAGVVLEKYRDTVTVKKKSWREESFRIGRFLRSDWANKNLSAITTADLERYLQKRQGDNGRISGSIVGAGTIIRETALLKTIFKWAVEQGYCVESVAKKLKTPKEPEHRERIASAEDIERLKIACAWDGKSVPVDIQQLTICAFLFGCATGMRAGEIVRIEPAWVDSRVIHIPADATKTGARRSVALSSEAVRLLTLADRFDKTARYFSALSNAVRDATFRRLRDRAGLSPVYDSQGRLIAEGLNFHDSRATFATWAASPNPKTGAPRLDVLTLARQTGHKNLKMLMRYYRASAESVADMLDK